MNRLNVTRLGFALASLFAVLYGASMLIVMTGPKDIVVAFFNSILHGIDVGPIMRWEMPWWEMVYKAEGKLVTNGIYAYMRHPQYTGIYVITLGFMIQWPTLTTLILWPFVIWMYYRLARKEEQEALKKLPEQYRKYMHRTPMFFPKLSELVAVNKRRP